jgi:integrase
MAAGARGSRALDTAKGETGPPCPRPYNLRHSYAAWSLAAGVPAHDVSRDMGSSLRMIDLTYGHLVPGSEEAARKRMDAFTNYASGAAEGGTR